MEAYLAKLIFHIDADQDKNETHFDEQTRFIEAASLKDAFIKARHIGKQEEISFSNKDNKKIYWKFIDVSDIFSLNAMQNGEQVFANTYENENKHAFIQLIKHKSQQIEGMLD